jgi:NAD(P)-dependent dehydrogenase (short-subunit alcohol dehydrogenase family)
MNIYTEKEGFINPQTPNTMASTLIHLTRRPQMDTSTRIGLVTGGSRGLGRNTALKLAEKGADVVLTYHSNRAAADAVVQQIAKLGRRAVALQLDTGDAKSFASFAQRLQEVLKETFKAERFDYLVNNAGVSLHASFAETSEAQFDEVMNVHLKGVFFLTQKLLPLLRDGGRIVNVSTGLTRFTYPGLGTYAAMKGAIEVLTRYLAKELAPRGITVNVVAPGAIETDFSGGLVRDNPEVNKQIASQTALGRVGVPDDIGGVIASLLGPENRWITGQRIEASGGMLL